jgi:hypothetical protein
MCSFRNFVLGNLLSCNGTDHNGRMDVRENPPLDDTVRFGKTTLKSIPPEWTIARDAMQSFDPPLAESKKIQAMSRLTDFGVENGPY